MEGTYRALLTRGRSRQLIAALGAAWLSFGMVGLAIFLTAHRTSGSYGLAGVAVAAFAVGSGLLAPLRGRLLDRRGARPWLPAFAGGYAIALLAFAGLARAGASSWALSLCAAAAGASAPPLVASLRALWPRGVEQAQVRRAYALTSVIGDIGLVVAPALGGLLFVVAPWLPLAVCAISAIAAALVVARVSATAVRREVKAKVAAPLLTRGLKVLLAVEMALGTALGLADVAIPAAATRWGETSYSGFLLGAFALGSVAGGIWFGRRDWKSSPQRRYLVATLFLALALVPPIAATGAATRTAADHLRTCLRASDDLTLRSPRHPRPVSCNRSSHLGYNRRRYWHSRRQCRVRLGHRALRTVGAVRSRLTHSGRCRRARTMEQPTGSASQPVMTAARRAYC
jgi:MFS family permease